MKLQKQWLLIWVRLNPLGFVGSVLGRKINYQGSGDDTWSLWLHCLPTRLRTCSTLQLESLHIWITLLNEGEKKKTPSVQLLLDLSVSVWVCLTLDRQACNLCHHSMDLTHEDNIHPSFSTLLIVFRVFSFRLSELTLSRRQITPWTGRHLHWLSPWWAHFQSFSVPRSLRRTFRPALPLSCNVAFKTSKLLLKIVFTDCQSAAYCQVTLWVRAKKQKTRLGHSYLKAPLYFISWWVCFCWLCFDYI